MTATLRTWRRRLLVVGGVAAVVLTAGGVATGGETSASWLDPEHAGGTLTATAVNPPTRVSCAKSGSDLVVTWTAPAVGPRTQYRYRYEDPNGALLASGVTTALSVAFTSTKLSDGTVTVVTEWLGSATTWTSTAVRWTVVKSPFSCPTP